MQNPGPDSRLVPSTEHVAPDLASRAERVAVRAHDGQVDKTGAPYIGHCRRVAAKLSDPEDVAVALLHDVIEDTAITETALREEFGDRITDAVLALTRVDGEAPDDYYSRVRANPLALQVKLADIHDNLEPSRVAALDAQTAQRLMTKYGKALVALSTEAAAPEGSSES